ncbi:Caleosin-domain-containing protein [Terfezia boudieri ATCC MYA-4762]|uniref:Caleosin-domain-containing protein n=1 Tax=Terfezia boudieri ATCC MYA-4762 TaxID=1051890 RepID=A0A3N4LK08_9PEZI|nr:Caleosin-domain-containing protein [Terfezia boudieri ATCC MYA-4762]
MADENAGHAFNTFPDDSGDREDAQRIDPGPEGNRIPSFIADPPHHHEFSHPEHYHLQRNEHMNVKEQHHVPHHHGHEKEDHPRGKIITGISTVPPTQEFPPYVPKEAERGKGLVAAGVPRVNVAASVENPYGTSKDDYALKHSHETVLQQHVAFFDRDKDGIIWPQDTYIGFRRLGFNILVSHFAAFVIHLNLSFRTVPGVLPDPLFRIWLDNIHKTKHGSDTNTYDSEGRFSPQHFEDFFQKYSSVSPGHPAVGKKGEKGSVGGDGGPDQNLVMEQTKKGLTYRDFLRGWNSNRRLFDPVGWCSEFLEWTATYLLLWPADGIMRKEDIRRMYDGSLFWDIAEKRECERIAKMGLPAGQVTQKMVDLKEEKGREFSGGQN